MTKKVAQQAKQKMWTAEEEAIIQAHISEYPSWEGWKELLPDRTYGQIRGKLLRIKYPRASRAQAAIPKDKKVVRYNFTKYAKADHQDKGVVYLDSYVPVHPLPKKEWWEL